MKANDTKQRLKEFFIFGWLSTKPAKMFEKTPKSAKVVLATPSSQKAAASTIRFSDSV